MKNEKPLDKCTVEHKAFNKVLEENGGLITYGNVISDVCFGNYIRPTSQTECNGMTFKEGELWKADLKHFTKNNIPHDVFLALKKHQDDSLVCLTKIRHYSGENEKVHGWIVTTGNNIVHSTTPSNPKSATIMDYAVSQIAHKLSKKESNLKRANTVKIK
jgi:hypothetical protein